MSRQPLMPISTPPNNEFHSTSPPSVAYFKLKVRDVGGAAGDPHLNPNTGTEEPKRLGTSTRIWNGDKNER
jgi:hypothetical protein